MAELKEELSLATGGLEREEELQEEERERLGVCVRERLKYCSVCVLLLLLLFLFCVCLFRCEELVDVYLRDPSPEARLLVGGDLRKIQLCFTLLKVYIHTHSTHSQQHTLTAHTLTAHTHSTHTHSTHSQHTHSLITQCSSQAKALTAKGTTHTDQSPTATTSDPQRTRLEEMIRQRDQEISTVHTHHTFTHHTHTHTFIRCSDEEGEGGGRESGRVAGDVGREGTTSAKDRRASRPENWQEYSSRREYWERR